MRIVVAQCTVRYCGRLQAYLPLAKRMLMVKADGSVLVHCDGGSYKPLNWMSPPCRLTEISLESPSVPGTAALSSDEVLVDTDLVEAARQRVHSGGLTNGGGGAALADGSDSSDRLGPWEVSNSSNLSDAATSVGDISPTDLSDPAALASLADLGVSAIWKVKAKKGEDLLEIHLHEVVLDQVIDLGVDPGLVKDGVEAHLQTLLAQQVHVLGQGWRLVRREYPTPIGPVDLLVRDAQGAPVAVEVKRRGEIAGVEQLTRYLELLGRDPALAGITGIFAAQQIKPQARTLAQDRGIRCVALDYQQLRGFDDAQSRLF